MTKGGVCYMRNVCMVIKAIPFDRPNSVEFVRPSYLEAETRNVRLCEERNCG